MKTQCIKSFNLTIYQEKVKYRTEKKQSLMRTSSLKRSCQTDVRIKDEKYWRDMISFSFWRNGKKRQSKTSQLLDVPNVKRLEPFGQSDGLMETFLDLWRHSYSQNLSSQKAPPSWCSLHTKKRSFLLRISSVNVTKSAGNCGFDHIYWRNP